MLQWALLGQPCVPLETVLASIEYPRDEKVSLECWSLPWLLSRTYLTLLALRFQAGTVNRTRHSDGCDTSGEHPESKSFWVWHFPGVTSRRRYGGLKLGEQNGGEVWVVRWRACTTPPFVNSENTVNNNSQSLATATLPTTQPLSTIHRPQPLFRSQQYPASLPKAPCVILSLATSTCLESLASIRAATRVTVRCRPRRNRDSCRTSTPNSPS